MLSPLCNLTNWPSDSTCKILANRESPEYRFVIQSQAVAPLSKRQRLSLVLNHFIAAAIACLLCLYRPSTVARLVVAIIVFAVNGMLVTRALPHVGVEVLKRVEPPLADRYSAVKVPFLPVRIRQGASGNHISPASIFAGVEHSVSQLPCSRLVIFQAAAAFADTRLEVCGRDNGFIAAFAQAPPSRKRPMGSASFDDSQATKYTPSQIAIVSGVFPTIPFSHSDAPVLGNWKKSIGDLSPLRKRLERAKC